MQLSYFFDACLTVWFFIRIWIVRVLTQPALAQCVEDSACPVSDVQRIIAAFQYKYDSSAAKFIRQGYDLLCQREISGGGKTQRRDGIVPVRVKANRDKDHLRLERLHKRFEDLVCHLLIDLIPSVCGQRYIHNPPLCM